MTLVSMAVAPNTDSVDAATTQQFTATGTYSDASEDDITGDVTWETSDEAVATIDANGVLTGVAEGTCVVTATLGAVSDDSGTITVVAVLTSITVSAAAGLTFRPTASTDRLQMTATGHHTGKADTVITTSVTWSSGTAATATISNAAGHQGEVAAAAGAITGAGEATTAITATLGAISDTETVTVDTAVDATSGWRCSVNAYQWTLLGETPAGLWLCQEASGNLADSIGSLTLAAVATPTYSGAITGWTRVAVGCNGTTDGFRAAAGAGPDPTTTSRMWIFYVSVPATAAGGTRGIVFVSDSASPMQLGHTSTDRLRVTVLADTSGTGLFDPGDVRFCMLQYDRANSFANGYTDHEKIVGLYSALVLDGNKGIGTGANTAALAGFLYGAMPLGSAAERSTALCAVLANKLTKTTVSWS